MKRGRFVPLLSVLAGLAMAGPLRAQTTEIAGFLVDPSARSARPEAFGTAALTMFQIAASRCTPIAGTTANFAPEGYVHTASGPGYFDCPLNLPAGSKLVRIEVLTHDVSDAGSMTVILGICPVQAPGNLCAGAAITSSTGTAAAPFDGKVSVDVNGVVIDKTANLYIVRVGVNSTTGDVKFRQVDVYYQLQISTPLPGTQTFGDVPPSYTYYKAIEALAASGITGGCGGGNFCPGNNVTRGEIAVLFARALGLHFPN
jgi:hypothetical protein